MQIICEEVHVFNHEEMPDEKETIADSLDLDVLIPLITDLYYYFRTPEDCPFAHGNWILDVRTKDGNLL